MAELERVRISPDVWPGKNLQVQPGDLSRFASYGNGVYGYQENPLNSIRGDPAQAPSGGLVYFGNEVRQEDFLGFLRMISVKADDKDYATFVQESSNPVKDRFFRQMRIVPKFGLRFMFRAIDNREYNSFNEQELTIGETLWYFMETERKRFGTSFGDPKIEGKMGGDGNYAREQLGFGFMLENWDHNIYRIWSRAWLVTK